MVDKITLKFKIKEKVESYNNNQKALYYNTFILKGLSILLIIGIISLILFFIIPLITPFMLKAGIISDAIALTFSGCFFSIGISLFLIYKFITRKGKQKKIIQKEDYISNKSCLNETNNDNLKDEGQLKFPKTKKKSILLRIIGLFEIIKDLLLLLISVLFSPVAKPNYIFIDQNKLDFTLWLIIELSKTKNYILDEGFIINNYENYSNTWFKNTLNSLGKLGIIQINKNNSETNTIFLHLDFYNPELS